MTRQRHPSGWPHAQDCPRCGLLQYFTRGHSLSFDPGRTLGIQGFLFFGFGLSGVVSSEPKETPEKVFLWLSLKETHWMAVSQEQWQKAVVLRSVYLALRVLCDIT